jgi:hypothetical protein
MDYLILLALACPAKQEGAESPPRGKEWKVRVKIINIPTL